VTTVLAFLGSPRRDSTNKMLLEAVQTVAPEGIDVVAYDGLDELPFYNEDVDVDGHRPAGFDALRSAAAAADAVLVVTPEYNGTMPATIKNMIDILSRPFGDSAVKGKPAAVIGSAFGQYGGVWAQEEARKALGIAGAQVLEEPQLAVAGAAPRFEATPPAEDPEIVAGIHAVLDALVAAAQELEPAAS
jgi:NAD(P)H-dependent FMN reductase